MQKYKSLRNALISAVPQFKNGPDMLRFFADSGHTDSRLASSLSFEKVYVLNVVVTGFTGELDSIFVPVQAWLREHQPDMMTSNDGREKGFTWLADINNDDSLDISISLKLTERTLVEEIGGVLHASYAPEPPPPEPVSRPTALYVNGELVSQWDE